jgi:hypothetical protein
MLPKSWIFKYKLKVKLSPPAPPGELGRGGAGGRQPQHLRGLFYFTKVFTLLNSLQMREHVSTRSSGSSISSVCFISKLQRIRGKFSQIFECCGRTVSLNQKRKQK